MTEVRGRRAESRPEAVGRCIRRLRPLFAVFSPLPAVLRLGVRKHSPHPTALTYRKADLGGRMWMGKSEKKEKEGGRPEGHFVQANRIRRGSEPILRGFGIERSALRQYEITDIRLLHENDRRFLRPF